jgi:uncharacterized membrane protein YoaK (UPF0700 family)
MASITNASSTKERSIFYHLTNKQALMCFTFIGGYFDATSFYMLYGIFASSITGNIVAAATHVYVNKPGLMPRVYACLFIALGSWITTMYSMKIRFAYSFTKNEVGVRLLFLEMVSLFICMVVGLCLKYPNVNSGAVSTQTALMAFTMGIQNAVAIILIPNCPVTTAMTGNTIRFSLFGAEALNYKLASLGLVDLYPSALGKPADYDTKMAANAIELRSKFRSMVASLGPFTAGCIVAVPVSAMLGMGSLVVPLVIITFPYVLCHAGQQKAKAIRSCRSRC